MTRGKHGRSSESRATNRVTLAEDKARNAEIRASRLSHDLAERDAEIERLKDAVTQARVESTKPGTYTEADMAQVRLDAEASHRAAIRTGFQFLKDKGADAIIPMGHFAELVIAFDCHPTDILNGATNKSRSVKRVNLSAARAMDESVKQERRA